MPVYVRNLREINSLLSKADDETRKGLRQAERSVADPIKATAQDLAATRIPRTIRGKVDWSAMRIGVTQKAIYVAPRERGVGKRHPDDPRRRPKFATLMMDRAMEPALRRHEGEIEQRFGRVLDYVAGRFNAAGTAK